MPDEKETIKKWIETWEKAGSALGVIRAQEIRNVNTSSAIRLLSSSFSWARQSLILRSSSGLVEQQFFFKKLHPHD